MKKKKVICICASASHYPQVLTLQKELRNLGFHVTIPRTANIMKKNKNFDVSFYKTWYKDAKDYHKKTKLMVEHFKKILASDAILVANFEKNGLSGYIGGNVLMEMVVAFQNKKPIYLYHDISEKLPILEEVYGLRPVILEEDLTKLKNS